MRFWPGWAVLAVFSGCEVEEEVAVPLPPVIVQKPAQPKPLPKPPAWIGYRWRFLKASIRCSGRGAFGIRVQDLFFKVGSQEGDTILDEALSRGSYRGVFQDPHFGIHYNQRHLIYVQKIAKGGRVVYNIALSLCAYEGLFATPAGLERFRLTYAMMKKKPGAKSGEVEARLYFFSEMYGGNVALLFGPIHYEYSRTVSPESRVV